MCTHSANPYADGYGQGVMHVQSSVERRASEHAPAGPCGLARRSPSDLKRAPSEQPGRPRLFSCAIHQRAASQAAQAKPPAPPDRVKTPIHRSPITVNVTTAAPTAQAAMPITIGSGVPSAKGATAAISTAPPVPINAEADPGCQRKSRQRGSWTVRQASAAWSASSIGRPRWGAPSTGRVQQHQTEAANAA
jgi:hypothetical protein